jgi:class 3 adenylate cyclase/tetratricopeptide (TPR) repeat protein
VVRKTVTIVFADLVGSTALGDTTDPELLQEQMSRYHAELRTILERHGGTVEKFIGDAAMAVFGLPQAHEDDALRAVRAAAEIRDAMAALELEVRIGVNTGEVIAGEGETLVSGDAVNVAARFEQSADAGEIRVGESTEGLVRDAVRTQRLEPLQLKGKADPVVAFRLLDVSANAPAFTRRIDAPFVGRETELEALETALQNAAERREPRLATVVGAPGIGKSRLVRELLQRTDARVLVGRCLSYGEGITYWPLQEVVGQVGDLDTALPDELARSRIAAAVGEGLASSDEIAWGFRRLFEELGRARPLIVVVDDIHWAEPTLLDLLEYTTAFASDTALLLLCTARPELFEIRPEWATPKPNATLVMLEPLAATQTEQLVVELGELSEDSRAQIVEAAEGNPLFVEQLVAHQAEAGNGKPDIPPTIQALLAARIDRLEPRERSVIERASVEGRLFHRGSVQALLPEEERRGVGAQLLTLVRKEFVRPDRSQLPGDDGFRFGHILIRDAAYDSIPKRLRAELHERFADWMGERMGEQAPPEIVGYHLEQAYRYGAELGQPDETLAARAGRVLAVAGRRAYERDDVQATRSLLGAARKLLPAHDPGRPEVLRMLGRATVETGDAAPGIELLREAQRAAGETKQRGEQLRARMTELGYRWEDSEAAETEARAAIAELGDLGDDAALCAAWWLLSMVGSMRNDFALKEEASRRRLEHARRAGQQDEVVRAANVLAAALAQGETPVDDAIVEVESLIAEFPDDRPGEGFLATLYALAGRDADAVASMERSRGRERELGHRIQYAARAMEVALIAILAGDPGRAEADVREGAEILEAAGERDYYSTVAACLAEMLYELGRVEEAEEWARRSERAAAADDVTSQAFWRGTRAKVVARRGEADEALRLSAEAIEFARGGQHIYLLGNTLADRAQVLRLLGRDEEAREHFEKALRVYERKGAVPSIERMKKALAELR